MKTKIFLIGFVFLIAMGCEKEKIYDYNLYTGFWQTIHDSTTYIMLIQSIDPLLISYNVDGKEWDCVGLTNGKNWIAYNPTTSMTFEYIKKYYNDKLFEIIPKDAYHKDDCMVVLGRGHGAIIQLSEWIDKLKELGAIIEKYKTGATGVQAMFSGITGMVVYIPKDKK